MAFVWIIAHIVVFEVKVDSVSVPSTQEPLSTIVSVVHCIIIGIYELLQQSCIVSVVAVALTSSARRLIPRV